MYYRLLVFFLLLGPAIVSAKGLVPCGGPDEDRCQTCHVVMLINNVIEWLVIILGTIAAIIIVFAGAKLVTSGGNTQAMTSAKSLITNMIIGYVIVLSGWLLIDLGMKTFLNVGTIGVWNAVQCVNQPIAEKKAILTLEWKGGLISTACTPLPNGGSSCNTQQDACITGGGTPTIDTSVKPNVVRCDYPEGSAAPAGYTDGTVLAQCSPGNSACSVSALQAAGLNLQQANIMSCIAITESSGIASTPPYNVTHPGSNSSACGTFQVVRTTWNTAASGACSSFSNCQNAACNIQVAVTLVRRNGYRDWTCPDCNNKAARCVAQYGG